MNPSLARLLIALTAFALLVCTATTEVAMAQLPVLKEFNPPGIGPGQLRFIRLEYAGGDWNHGFGQASDLNMLLEYGILTRIRVAKETESRTIARLKNFKPTSAPPFVYLTGTKNIKVSEEETKILREYLLEKGGMIFGDNGGSELFHEQFLAMMKRVLPDIEPVAVPLDDSIHKRPFPLESLPYVELHGGKHALGWKDEKHDRWLCYYHPGNLGGAWSDGHAGVDKDTYEDCYHLGVNVIFYACSQYNGHVLRHHDQPASEKPAREKPAPDKPRKDSLDNLLDKLMNAE